jgi:hypothetical protein
MTGGVVLLLARIVTRGNLEFAMRLRRPPSGSRFEK